MLSTRDSLQTQGHIQTESEGMEKIFRANGNQKLYRQAKAKKIQLHQTSFTTNVKVTSLGRKHKRRKRPTITNPKQLTKW